MFHLIKARLEQPAHDLQTVCNQLQASRCCGEPSKARAGVLGRGPMNQGSARVARIWGHGLDVTRAGGVVGKLRAFGLGERGGFPGGGDNSRNRLKGSRYSP